METILLHLFGDLHLLIHVDEGALSFVVAWAWLLRLLEHLRHYALLTLSLFQILAIHSYLATQKKDVITFEVITVIWVL